MSSMIRFGLLGCGAIAKRHAEILADHSAGAKLVAVCDVNESRVHAFAQKYKVPAFRDITGMMRSGSIDAVTVLTPSGLHASHVEELARFGQAIVVEKPMALSLEDADRMIAACDRYGARLFVVKQNRFNRPVIALKEALEAGRFGKLVMGTIRVRWCRAQSYYDADGWRGTWAYDGGVLANQASHHIDLLEWMMGPVDSVAAISSRALARIEAEDTAAAIMRFQNGAIGIIEATTATRPRDLEGSLSILGEQASVEIGGFSANELKTWNFAQPTEADRRVFEDFGKNPPHPNGYGHAAYYAHVVDCLRQNKRQLVDGLEGRKSLEMVVALYEAIETGVSVQMGFSPKRCRLGHP